MYVDMPKIKAESGVTEVAVNLSSGHFPPRMKSEQLSKPISNTQLIEVPIFI